MRLQDSLRLDLHINHHRFPLLNRPSCRTVIPQLSPLHNLRPLQARQLHIHLCLQYSLFQILLINLQVSLQ